MVVDVVRGWVVSRADVDVTDGDRRFAFFSKEL